MITEIKRDKEEENKVILGEYFNEENEEGLIMKRYLEEEGLANTIGSRIGKIPPTRSQQLTTYGQPRESTQGSAGLV